MKRCWDSTTWRRRPDRELIRRVRPLAHEIVDSTFTSALDREDLPGARRRDQGPRGADPDNQPENDAEKD